MTTQAYELSISQLCDRLDELVRSVTDEYAAHRERVQQLRAQSEAADDPEEVRGAVLASAFALLEAVENLGVQVSEVREIIAQQQTLLTSLHQESRTDALTGMLNRRAFDEEITRRASESLRSGMPLGLVMVDIDHFKATNDTYGHAAGDKVLKGVANVLANSLREMDIVARYGGEEFALILPNTNLLNSCRAAERARVAIARSIFQANDDELTATISAGVAVLETTHAEMIRTADDALYAAKQAGRNRVFAFKDGYCQPLQQEPVGTTGSQRRRWMRFLINDFSVKLQCGAGPWFPAHVKDESLTGIGVVVEQPLQLTIGEIVRIDYCDDIRDAEVMSIGVADDETASTRVGLRWCNPNI